MNKRGVSVVIGYVLLIGMVVVISLAVFAWLKTYVPREIPKCPTDVSISIKEAICTADDLKLIIENNGLFSVDGYFIRGSTNPDQEATINLAESEAGEFVKFAIPLRPNQESFEKTLDLSGVQGNIVFIEIIPIRIQPDEEGKKRLATCGDAKVKENVC